MYQLLVAPLRLDLFCDHHESTSQTSTRRSSIKIEICNNTKLNIFNLIIKREPSDVNPAGWLEDTWRNLLASPGVPHDDVGWEGGIKVFIGAVVEKNVRFPHFDWWNSDVIDASILCWVPHQTIIIPVERQPNIACQDLVLLIQINYLL